MSYRKLTIDGKTFEYVIGKVNTKIKGIGVFDNGNLEEWFSERDPSEDYEFRFSITPSIIRELIEQKHGTYR